jgi:cytochrome P450
LGHPGAHVPAHDHARGAPARSDVAGRGEGGPLLPLGNRDERAIDRPWDFDVSRDPNRHLGFGGGGTHYCLGASLAKTQLRAIFGELLRVMPDLEAGEPELLRSAFMHGVKRMPCTFTARA